MDRLPGDTRDILLTPEFVAKSNKDIETIASLNTLAEKWGAMFALSGGYATEAHCGGKITRPHGDIDAKFIFETLIEDTDPLFNDVWQILSREETKWFVRKDAPGKVEYLEDDRSDEFFNKRRLEVRIPVKGWYEATFEEKKLVDSKGRAIKVMVLSLTDLVVSKIEKLYEVRNGVDTKRDRHTDAADFFDLKRLFDLEQLDREGVMKKLAKRAKSDEKAKAQWDYADGLIKAI